MYQSLFISSSNHGVNSFEFISIHKLAFLALALGIFPKSHLTWVAQDRKKLHTGVIVPDIFHTKLT